MVPSANSKAVFIFKIAKYQRVKSYCRVSKVTLLEPQYICALWAFLSADSVWLSSFYTGIHIKHTRTHLNSLSRICNNLKCQIELELLSILCVCVCVCVCVSVCVCVCVCLSWIGNACIPSPLLEGILFLLNSPEKRNIKGILIVFNISTHITVSSAAEIHSAFRCVCHD